MTGGDSAAATDRTCSVVGVGELLWDLLPDGPRLGGAPFNAVAHLARLGCRTTYVSAVGRDELGQRALTEVARLGVESDLITIADLPTGVVRIELDAHGVPAYEIVSPAAYEAIELPDHLDPSIAGGADMIVLGTLAQRFAGVRAATRRIMGANPRAAVLYDVNLRHGCWDAGLVERLIGDATVVKLNEDEQATLAAALDLPASSTERFARAARDRYGLRGVCVTRGPDGATLLLDDVYGEAPAPRVIVVDTVGAGDAFAAGLGYGLLNSWTVPEILSVATRLGALVASRPGAIPAWDPADIGITA
jgi:fructokinase